MRSSLAGCPVCDFHLHEFVRRRSEIVDAGVREVVVFHSTVSELIEYESHLPFDVIADPNKRLYRELGVESSIRALLDPRVWPIILWAVLRILWRMVRHGAPIPPLQPGGGRFGLTADFLIDRDGRILAARYGAHAADHWSVDDLLFLVARTRDDAASDGGLPAAHVALAKAATRLAHGAYAVLALTTLHHVYGALRYQIPFRLHVVVIAAVVAGFVGATHRRFLRRQSLPALITFAAATLLFPVAGIGVFDFPLR